MKRKTLYLALVLPAVIVSAAFAQRTFNVAGVELPLIEGALDHGDTGTAGTNVETFITDAPLAEVVAFYSGYFKKNGFMVIGGADNFGFNASVKKGPAMFTVNIYSENSKTILQFIW